MTLTSNEPQAGRRPRVFALYSTLPALRPFGGDQISELETLRWMSQVCDVDYNGVPYDPASDEAGEPEGGIRSPGPEYDLVYVRGNRDVLQAARDKGIRTLYFGDMDDPATAASVDAVAVHNNQEAALLKTVAPGVEALLAEQPGRDGFKPRQGSRFATELSKRWGGGFTLGFFGRIDAQCFPNTVYGAKDILQHYIPDMNMVFAGKLRWKYTLPGDLLHEQRYFKPDEMPHALSACAATIGIEQPEAEHAGSNRTIECVRCRVPVITRPYAARREQLGDDYPLFFSDIDELTAKVVALRYDPVFQRQVREHLDALRPKFAYREIQNRNAARLLAWLSGP